MANDLEISSSMLRSGCAGFDDALVALKHGQVVTRKAWPLTRYLKMSHSLKIPGLRPFSSTIIRAFIVCWPEDGRRGTPWTATQDDLLDEDWTFYKPEGGD
jgi:hypothetical protein